MAVKSTAAYRALYAALLAKSQEPIPRLPKPLKNERLMSRMLPWTGGTEVFFNVVLGGLRRNDELLGADSAAAAAIEGYDLELRPRLELVISGKSDAAREAAFDAALEAIMEAIEADRTLGGAVQHVAVIEEDGVNYSDLSTDGMPNVEAVEITLALSFTSARPF